MALIDCGSLDQASHFGLSVGALWPMLPPRLPCGVHCTNIHSITQTAHLPHPRFSNIDTEVSHAHVHEDALWWKGVRSLSLCWWFYVVNMATSCQTCLCGPGMKNMFGSKLDLLRSTAFFVCEANRLPVFVQVAIATASSQARAGRHKSGNRCFCFQHKRISSRKEPVYKRSLYEFY